MLTLLNLESESVFQQLAEHIHSRVKVAKTEAQGLTAFDQAVTEWRTLFTPARRFSKEQIRGLFAELTVGFLETAEFKTVNEIASSWSGPFGADQDFIFTNLSIEVKSRHSTSRAVKIASEFQLDGENLFLAVATIVDGGQPFEDSRTLPRLVSEIKSKLLDNGQSLSAFEDALDELGVDLDDPFYDDFHLCCSGVDYYDVQPTFPKITPNQLCEGLTGVSYNLQLAEISEFETELIQIMESRTKEGDCIEN